MIFGLRNLVTLLISLFLYFVPPLIPTSIYFQKYIDIFAGTLGFWLFGYAISGNSNTFVLGEDQDFIFWFFRVSTFLLCEVISRSRQSGHGLTNIWGMVNEI